MGHFFSEKESAKLIDSISNIEKTTQGEIRIHIEDICEDSPINRAIEVFDKLKMHQTKEGTGVLIYLASEDKKVAIVGDKGIDAKVNNEFWDTVIESMMPEFKNANFVNGFLKGLTMVGKELATHFPKKIDNQNELSNEISYGKI